MTYWKLADEKLAEYRRLEGQSLVPSLNDYIGKNQGKETDYQKALTVLFESDDHPEIYPIPITGDTTLLLMALGWKEYEKEYRKAEKDASGDDEGKNEGEDDSSLDEPIVKPRSAQYAACFVPSLPAKLPAKPKAKTNLKPVPPSKDGKGGKGSKVTKPTKGKSALPPPLPRVTLIPFPQRKGFPYALLGDTKALKDYLNEMNSGNKIASYVSNVNGQFGPGWNLKKEGAEKIRESDGSEFELVEYETLEEYEKISRPKAD